MFMPVYNPNHNEYKAVFFVWLAGCFVLFRGETEHAGHAFVIRWVMDVVIVPRKTEKKDS